jgi:hypothetical protein
MAPPPSIDANSIYAATVAARALSDANGQPAVAVATVPQTGGVNPQPVAEKTLDVGKLVDTLKGAGIVGVLLILLAVYLLTRRR